MKQRSPRAKRRSATEPEKAAGLSTNRFCITLVCESADPRLTWDSIHEHMATAAGAAVLRRAVLAGLPKSVRRLASICSPEEMQQLSRLHEVYGEEIAKRLGVPAGNFAFGRPPPDYIPPSQE